MTVAHSTHKILKFSAPLSHELLNWMVNRVTLLVVNYFTDYIFSNWCLIVRLRFRVSGGPDWVSDEVRAIRYYIL